ncbi:MAG: 1-acyl-sn-glycerol-3-phosphate acyltransferase [Actinobacteria bacterium]|nr:1-acyl-sn-glycerol-3-phosphate acyltransferase [Actinomycetota bacterium]NIS30258.1 1-acyl-sn-glycerol-3-phosphate acyltransferase [Actinomycetota bacterium]NIT94957.1 1-acyl-sn-glycerol-3-phosphate acyltransferase [Actinomycetota bacterium]NIU18636.1 1-acyl-sn-glycerol-3-phosphate acyltransferase [Actinomycetota bacterium]NIU65502.1 1-acyl-sn-glycerol-3-phosphate acyltransferase [Actinomycetota bacterium]
MSQAPTYGSQEGETPERSRQTLLGRVLYRCFWVLVFSLIKVLFRLRVEGRENLPDGPFILSAVHRSFVDTPIVGVITGKRLRFMGKESLWGSKPLGAFLTVMGGFPVERGTADRTALRAAEDVLALGEPLVMFPEGTRQEGPRLDRALMHDGPAFVAARAGVPIVPVGLGGTPSALPLGAKIPRPAKVVAVIGAPIEPSAKVDGRVPRRAVRELTDELYERLGALYVEARVKAGDEPGPAGGVSPTPPG